MNPSEILPQYSKFCQELQFQNFDKNENIGERSRPIYVISQLIFWGQGVGEILPKVLPKVSAKFWENVVSSIFTNTATLAG